MLELVDLFCGAGGMSLGLQQSGIVPRLGVDRNADCIDTYRSNIKDASVLIADVADLRPSQILDRVSSRDRLVLAGCPPCQLFSQLHRSDTPIGTEIDSYLKIIRTVRPLCVVFENVPQVTRRHDVWIAILHQLHKLKYHVRHGVVPAVNFGVPQNRVRLLLVAARDPVELPEPLGFPMSTVRQAIGSLPDRDPDIPNHVSMKLSPTNLKRIKSIRRDGGLSRVVGSSFSDSYGRMYWDRPAPTITTKCVSFSNGRFGHPEYHRAITVREAALLQGFPMDFLFEGTLKQTARQVGNAVPPPLSRAVGDQILRSLGIDAEETPLSTRAATGTVRPLKRLAISARLR